MALLSPSQDLDVDFPSQPTPRQTLAPSASTFREPRPPRTSVSTVDEYMVFLACSGSFSGRCTLSHDLDTI